MTQTLEELRLRIEELAETVDTPEGRYSHNIIALDLKQIADEYGVAAANEAIQDFGVSKPWAGRPAMCRRASNGYDG